MDEAQLKSARLAALRLLTASALTSSELRLKLAGKGFAEEAIALLIAEFTRRRLLDDAGIVDDVIERSALQKLEGRRQIRNRLVRRGINSVEAEERLKEVYTVEGEFAAALEFAKKKLRSMLAEPANIKRRRIGGALDRRGFPSEVINRVLSEISFSAEEPGQAEDN